MKRIKNIARFNLTEGSFLLLAVMAANFLNFLFNAFLGRTLNFTDYGLVNLITQFLYLEIIIVNGLYSTLNHRIAVLSTENPGQDYNFYRFVLKKSVICSSIAALIWISLSPFLSNFFSVGSVWPIVSFAPLLVFGITLGVMKGYLQGKLLFAFAGMTIITEALSKLVIAFIMVSLGFGSLTYLSLPLSTGLALLTALYAVNRIRKTYDKNVQETFPYKFFGAALITGIAGSAFLTLDVILAKHFLSPEQAGQYALLSLVGKMVYFIGTLFSPFIMTYVSREEGQHKKSDKTFLTFLTLSILATLTTFLVVGPFGSLTIPFLFGKKTLILIPYLTFYTSAISLFTISSPFLVYHLTKHNYIFPFISIILSISMIIGINLFHNSILQIVQVIFATSALNFISMISLHFLRKFNFSFLGVKDIYKIYE